MKKYVNSITIRRIIAILLSVCVAVVMLYFVSFEASHGMHHCENRACPICHELQVAAQIIKQLSNGIIAIALGIFFVICRKHMDITYLCSNQERTLILDKVRMDD